MGEDPMIIAVRLREALLRLKPTLYERLDEDTWRVRYRNPIEEGHPWKIVYDALAETPESVEKAAARNISNTKEGKVPETIVEVLDRIGGILHWLGKYHESKVMSGLARWARAQSVETLEELDHEVKKAIDGNGVVSP